MQLQKVDPPAQVIDAFRDVQAARADLERCRTRRRPTPTAWCRKRAAAPPRSRRRRKPIKQQTVAEATGQTSRFLKIYEQYKKAPDVTRERMYLETMERVFGGTDKIIIDSGKDGARRRALSAAQRICAAPAAAAPPAPPPGGNR